MEETFPGKVTNSRGLGLFLAFDLEDGETRGKALSAMVDAGLVGLASGSRSVRFRPPLIVDETLAQVGLQRIETALGAVL